MACRIPHRALLAGLFCSLLQAQHRDLKIAPDSTTSLDQRSRLWAVVVGISHYDNVPPQAQLKFADRDAQAFAAFLRSPAGGGFPSDHVQTLLNNQASLSALRTALGTWLARSAEPEDIVYIFFAGHGVTEGEHDGYLLARDSDPQNLYATALPITELDKIITQRVHARHIVLIADACHAGNIGWSSRGIAEQVMVGRYLAEIGQSGQGVLRLLASRSDERSYEDPQWGGGHGAFTYFLLEGLSGKADMDHDGVVRAAELIDYLASVVPQQTKALQHPQAAGHMDPAMALAVVARTAPSPASAAAGATLELQGAAGTEVYLDNRYYGRIRPAGTLIVDTLTAGSHDLSFDPPGGDSVTQPITLSAGRTVLRLSPSAPKLSASQGSPTVAAIRQAIAAGNIQDAGGAWDLYQRLVRETPQEPQRRLVETQLSMALEETGQRAINEYVHAPITEMRRDTFHRAARAFADLEMIRPGDQELEAKQLFCTGRALVVDGKFEQAVAALQKAAALDPRAAYIQNALGVAHERLDRNREAVQFFHSAASLAPAWALPHLHLGLQYQAQGDKSAEKEFKTAIQLDPRQPFLREALAQYYHGQGRNQDAERELETLTQFAPGYAPAYRELGKLYEVTREYARAAAAFENYLRLAPDAPDSAAIRARIAEDRTEKKPPTLRR
jgi:tetratricopeptide (TPR) repeat protein